MTATEYVEPEYVILVDELDQQTGTAEKLFAHQNNLLHRAFSVFIFRSGTSSPEVLLQQRALGKYHSPGLWTNTCCSHPRPGEAVLAAGQRRLNEEMGFSVPLRDVGWFRYQAAFDNGLSEHEVDHVLVGMADAGLVFTPNPAEVHAWQWVGIAELEQAIKRHPESYTPWLAEALSIAKTAAK